MLNYGPHLAAMENVSVHIQSIYYLSPMQGQVILYQLEFQNQCWFNM